MSIQKTILAFVAILMAVFILALGSSCSHSKDVFKNETSTKVESRTDDSLTIETLQNEVAELSRQIREMENQEFTFQECPTIDSAAFRNSIIELFKKDTSRLNQKIDSLIAAMNKKPATSTYKKDKDGNTEVSGPLKSVKTSKVREEQMTLKYTSIIQNLIESHVKTAATMMTKKEEKEKHSKGGFLNLPWLWIILAFIAGGYLGWRLRGGIKLIDKLNPSNMKNFIIVFIASLLLSSCGHYRDGSSVWQAGMWIAPLLTFIGFLFFGYTAWKSSRSGSTINPKYGGGEGGNVPIWQHGRFWFSVIFMLATIAIIWAVNAEK